MKYDGGKTSKKVSDKNRKVKVSFLKERIAALLGQSKHLEAFNLLEELASLQPFKELDTSLRMAECLLHLEKEREACDAIDAVRHIIVLSRALSADDLFTLARELCGNLSYVRAIILLRIASDLYKTNASSPDDKVNGINKCMDKTEDAIKLLILAGKRSRMIGLKFGVQYMKEMFEDLSAVKNAEPGNKTLKQASSLYHIGSNYGFAHEKEKRLKLLQSGIELLESQFGSDASKYRLYGFLLNNAGASFRHLGKFADAERFFEKAIEAKQKAADYGNENEKQNDLLGTKSNLKMIRVELGKI